MDYVKMFAQANNLTPGARFIAKMNGKPILKSFSPAAPRVFYFDEEYELKCEDKNYPFISCALLTTNLLKGKAIPIVQTHIL